MWQKHLNVTSSLHYMLENDIMTDITFIMGSGKVRGHRLIMSARSSVLMRLMEECKDSTLDLGEDISLDTFQIVMESVLYFIQWLIYKVAYLVSLPSWIFKV